MTTAVRTVGEGLLVWAVNADRACCLSCAGEDWGVGLGLGAAVSAGAGRGGGLLSYLCGRRCEAAERLACRR